MRRQKNLGFTTRMILSSFVPDLLAATVIFLYTITSTQTIQFAGNFVKPTLIMFFIMQFITAPLICFLAYNGISEKLFYFYNTDSSTKDRTLLLESLMTYPFICAIITFVYFAIGSILLYVFLHYVGKIWSSPMRENLTIICLIECLCCSYFSAIVAHKYASNICSGYAEDIVAKGVDYNYVMTKKIFNCSITVQMIIYIAIPAVITGFITVLSIFSEYQHFFGPKLNIADERLVHQSRLFFTCVLNSILQIILAILFYYQYSKNNKKMTLSLEKIRKQNLASNSVFPTAIGDDFEYSLYLANQMITLFQNILDKSSTVGNTIKWSTSELLELTTETEGVSSEQSATTKEIDSTMEVIKNLAHSIDSRIQDISILASKTSDDVNKGSVILKKNLNKISEIVEANENTIQGIKNLSEKIKNIWEIIKIINEIADQTKLIAFNAELESSKNTAENKNFKNVANEVRRLANNTVTSTKEIKDRITDIQDSSEELIKASQNYSTLILHGSELIKGLDISLSKIQSSAQQNSETSDKIKNYVKIQTESFDDISNSFKNISSAIVNISKSTVAIGDTSKELREYAENLENTAKILPEGESK